MAGARKLQAEIDRCMKKVAEGTDKFDETWLKVQNASNTNQKEKYEEDLKKEIKKLQRLRDQIKTWIASGEIKDKSMLMEKRKLIEMKMEKFKVVERETKTKAYSKEGLTSGTKMDPQERERHETTQWLNQCIDQLNLQIDSFEAEIESLNTSKKKKNRSENADKIEDFNNLCEKHREHVSKLETLLRMLDNDAVNISQIKDIKDDVEYYIENCQEPDFCENDMMYDDIDGFEEMMLDLSNVGGHEQNTNSVEASETMSTNSASSPIPYMQHNHSNSDQNESEKRRHKSSSEDSKGLSQSKVQPLSTSAAAAIQRSNSSGQASVASTGSGALPNGSNNSVTVNSSNAAASSGSVKTVAAVNNSNSGVPSAVPSSVPSGTPSTALPTGTATGKQQPGIHPGGFSAIHAAAAASQASSSTPNNSSPSSGSAGGGVSVVNNSSQSGAATVSNHIDSSASLHEAGRRDFLAAVNGGLNGHGPHVPSSSSVSSVVPSALVGGRSSSPVPTSTLQQQQSAAAVSSSAVMAPPSVGGAAIPSAAAITSSAAAAAQFSTMPSGSGASSGATAAQVQAHIQAQAAAAAAAQQAASAQAAAAAAQAAAAQAAASQLTSSSNVNDSLLPSLKAMATKAVDGLSITDLPQSAQQSQQQQQSLSVQQQQLQTATTQQPTVPVGSSNISQAGLFPVTAQAKDRSQKKTEAHIPPLLGVAPLGPVPLNKETQLQYAMLEAAFMHMPQPSDSERIRTHLPRNPCVTPAYYPQMPLPGSDSLDFFLRLTTETLFFIFYYMEGTKAQYLAAKALKKQSWRFHTKYLMWFQRHEEPTFINEDYEQGTYVYFDFEKWGQRTKTAFKFEYRFLEDSELI